MALLTFALFDADAAAVTAADCDELFDEDDDNEEDST